MSAPLDRDAFLRAKREAIDDSVYATPIPLIVAERIRGVTHYDDGVRVERPALLAVWYALRWLTETYPEHDGFGQRAIAAIAGVDQKTVHRRLRLLYQLEVITELGRRQYEHLTGGDDKAKVQPLYTIPKRELAQASLQEGPEIVKRWREELFGGSTAPPAKVPPNQLMLNLSDPLEDQERRPSDPLGDQAHPLSDPVEDQALILHGIRPDPLGDHHARAVGQSVSLSAGATFGHAAQPDTEQPRPDTPLVPPLPPPGERPLSQHPLTYLETQREAGADAQTFALLAAEHDAPTGGHGWYWLGRAIDAGVVAKGGIEQVRDLFRLTRSVLDSWRRRNEYGAPPPSSPRPRPTGPPRSHAPAARAVGEPVSFAAINQARHVDGATRAIWLNRFRKAPDVEAQRGIVARFLAEHPYPAVTKAAD